MIAPEGRVIMISGANRGIGRAIAEALYRAGYTLSLGARDPASLKFVAGKWVVVRVRIEDEKDTELDRMWAVNVKAPLSMIRTTLPHLRRSGAGRIVDVVSIAGKAVYNNNAGYAMTKFAAVALSHAARRAGWEDGVRCTALCPGFVATDMTADVETFPHDRMMAPDDIAEVVLTVLGHSNNASIAELVINCRDDVTM
jgi:NADP-dependent 3-hydroxy acid dehydrogenase YdfG